MSTYEPKTAWEATDHFADDLKSRDNDPSLQESRDQILQEAWTTFNDSIKNQLYAKPSKELYDPGSQDTIIQSAANRAEAYLVKEATRVITLSEDHQEEQSRLRRFMRLNLKPLRVSGEFIDLSLSVQQIRIAQGFGAILGLIPGILVAVFFPFASISIVLPFVFAGIALMTGVVHREKHSAIVWTLLTWITAAPTPRSRGKTAKRHFMRATEAWWDYALLMACGFETSLTCQQNIKKLDEDQPDMEPLYEAVDELKQAQSVDEYQNGLKRLCKAYSIPLHDGYPREVDLVSEDPRPVFFWQPGLSKYYILSGTVETGQKVEILEHPLYGSNNSIVEKGRVRRLTNE